MAVTPSFYCKQWLGFKSFLHKQRYYSHWVGLFLVFFSSVTLMFKRDWKGIFFFFFYTFFPLLLLKQYWGLVRSHQDWKATQLPLKLMMQRAEKKPVYWCKFQNTNFKWDFMFLRGVFFSLLWALSFLVSSPESIKRHSSTLSACRDSIP